MRIRKEDLEQHGCTIGWPGCMSAQHGKKRGNHTAESRERIEAITDDRRSRAQQRMQSWAETYAESAEVEGKPMDVLDTEKEDMDEQTGTGASGSGLTEEERKNVPDIVPDVELEAAPVEAPEMTRRFLTPERPAPVKRRPEDVDTGPDRVRED